MFRTSIAGNSNVESTAMTFTGYTCSVTKNVSMNAMNAGSAADRNIRWLISAKTMFPESMCAHDESKIPPVDIRTRKMP